MTDTWNYSSPIDTIESADLPEEWVWERLRLRRDSLLMASDFRVITDAPWDTEPWITYRQELRDLPDNTQNPREAIWPTPPNEV